MYSNYDPNLSNELRIFHRGGEIKYCNLGENTYFDQNLYFSVIQRHNAHACAWERSQLILVQLYHICLITTANQDPSLANIIQFFVLWLKTNILTIFTFVTSEITNVTKLRKLCMACEIAKLKWKAFLPSVLPLEEFIADILQRG